MVIARKKDEDYRGFGTIRLQQSVPLPPSDSSIETQQFQWIPNDEVASHGPENLKPEFLEIRVGSCRLVFPILKAKTAIRKKTVRRKKTATRKLTVTHKKKRRAKVGPFFDEGYLAGLAIRIARGLSRDDVRTIDTAWLYTDRLRFTHAWHHRQFNGPKDFQVDRAIRDELGINPLESLVFGNRCINTAALMRLGNEEARRNGIKKPTRVEAIQHALFALAKENPLPLDSTTPEQRSQLVRGALLDFEKAPSNVVDQELELVAREFAWVVNMHLDDSDEDFETFLMGPNNSIVGQITRRLEKPGLEISRDRVNAALAEQGWRGLAQWVGNLEVLMRCVAAELPEPLTGRNLKRYEILYYPQPWLDNKPLFLFAERFGFMRNGIEELLFGPDLEHACAVILRFLEFYGNLNYYRRWADRTVKQSQRRPTSRGGSTVEYLSEDDLADY